MSKSYIVLGTLLFTFGALFGWNYHTDHTLLVKIIDSVVATIMSLSFFFAITRMFISNGNRN